MLSFVGDRPACLPACQRTHASFIFLIHVNLVPGTNFSLDVRAVNTVPVSGNKRRGRSAREMKVPLICLIMFIGTLRVSRKGKANDQQL